MPWSANHCGSWNGRKNEIRKIYDNPHRTRRAIISVGRKSGLDDDGRWALGEWAKQRDQEHADYVALIREWNKNVTLFNNTVVKRNVGRPLEASEAQVKTVRQLRRRGTSLRDIAEETGLGLRTVRSILDQQDGTDRTSIKHLQRIDPERARERVWQAKRQMRQALPRRVAEVEKANAELRKEAKGLK